MISNTNYICNKWYFHITTIVNPIKKKLEKEKKPAFNCYILKNVKDNSLKVSHYSIIVVLYKL